MTDEVCALRLRPEGKTRAPAVLPHGINEAAGSQFPEGSRLRPRKLPPLVIQSLCPSTASVAALHSRSFGARRSRVCERAAPKRDPDAPLPRQHAYTKPCAATPTQQRIYATKHTNSAEEYKVQTASLPPCSRASVVRRWRHQLDMDLHF